MFILRAFLHIKIYIYQKSIFVKRWFLNVDDEQVSLGRGGGERLGNGGDVVQLLPFNNAHNMSPFLFLILIYSNF